MDFAELDVLTDRLKANSYDASKCPPPWLKISEGNKEKPDLWVRDPAKSAVVQVKADVR